MRLFICFTLLMISACATPPEGRETSRPLTVALSPPAMQMGTPPGALTLEQAVWLALEHNTDLKIQAYEPLVAGAFLARERARFSPELFATVSRRDSSRSETARATGEQFNADVEQFLLSGGIRREFSTGTDLELAVQQIEETSNRTPDQEEFRLTLSLTQALLQGGGQSVNLAAVRLATLDLAITDAEFKGYTEAIVAEVENAYWNFWLATEIISIAEQALEVADQQLADIRQRIEVGQLARNEEAVAQAEVARRRQVLIDARADTVRRRIELLALISPGNLSPEKGLEPLTPPTLPELDQQDTPALRIQLAETARADLREARIRLEQRRLDTVLTRDGLLPRLEFFAQLSTSGFGPDTGEAWSDFGGDSYDLQAGLRFSRSLGERAESARHDEARFRQDQAAAAVENLRLRIGSRLLLAINEWERAQQQIKASTETRHLQALTVDSEMERFQVGTGTALMVAQAQRDLLNSMVEEQRARVQARQALLALYLAEGTLLERRGLAPDAP